MSQWTKKGRKADLIETERKSGRKWQLAKAAVCTATLGLCMIMGMQEFQVFQSWKDRWCYESDTGILQETAEKVVKASSEDEDLPDLVFCTQKNNQIISIRSPVEKETGTNVILICGDPHLLTGNYNVPQTGDWENCLIDTTTAYQLFGSAEVVGASVHYGGQEYVISGVMEAPKSTMIIQMPAGSEETFNRVIALDNGNTERWNLKNVLRIKYQISVTEIHWDFLRWIVKLLYVLVVMVVYIRRVCLWNQKQLFPVVYTQTPNAIYTTDSVKFKVFTAEKKSEIYRVLEGAFGLLLLLVLLDTTGLTQISAEYIPAKWSDFSFYKELCNIWLQGMNGFLETALLTLETQWFVNCVLLEGWMILGGIASILGLRLLER